MARLQYKFKTYVKSNYAFEAQQDPLIIRYLKHQLKTGFSPIILVVGRQRTGKTSLALRLAYELEGKDFDVEKQMFFDIPSFIRAIDKYTKKVIILDEAGVELDPWKAMDNRNRAYSHIIQTQAYKNNVIFICLPFASEFGKTHRKHVQAVIHCTKRGSYNLYSAWSWHPDLNFTKIRMTTVENVRKVSMPPEEIYNVYKNKYEKQMKKQIMDSELKKFEPKQPQGFYHENSAQQSAVLKQELPWIEV